MFIAVAVFALFVLSEVYTQEIPAYPDGCPKIKCIDFDESKCIGHSYEVVSSKPAPYTCGEYYTTQKSGSTNEFNVAATVTDSNGASETLSIKFITGIQNGSGCKVLYVFEGLEMKTVLIPIYFQDGKIITYTCIVQADDTRSEQIHTVTRNRFVGLDLEVTIQALERNNLTHIEIIRSFVDCII